MKKFKVTVGIPAFNEQANIGFLLRALLSQKLVNLEVEKILVVSDGSTDETVDIVSKIKDNKINVFIGKVRLGKAKRENEIIARCNSEVLVILDADILIDDKSFIEKIVRPIIFGRADMTSSTIKPLKARNFFEQVLIVSTKLKDELFLTYKLGNNIYTCFGPARSFSKKLYKKLRFEQSNGEDMFSYLKCLELGFTFENVSDVVTHYRLPSNLSDHTKQSIRYHLSKKSMLKVFDKDLVKRELNIPPKVYFLTFLKSLKIIGRYPIHTVIYIFILLFSKLRTVFSKEINKNWNVLSSKIVRSSI